jgi:hypothetical protein
MTVAPGERRKGASASRRLWLLVALAAAWVCAGCAAMPDERRATFGIRFPPAGPDEKVSAIVFMVDGVNAGVFREMLDGGRLPNFRKYFVERGLYFERAAASVPTITLANETSIVTGVWPGHHGVTGNNWFDRNGLIERDYEEVVEKNLLDGDYRTPTLFERLGDATTFSLFYQAHRGATKFVENWMSAGPPFFLEWYGFVDRIALWRFDIVAEVARARREFPALVVSYVLSPDMQAYRHGVSSDAYRGALEHSDAQIGRILRDLEAAGRLERTVLALVSDHGMADVSRHWPIEKFFRSELRLAVAGEGPWESTPFERRMSYFNKFSCVLEGSGDRYWAVYLRKPAAAPPGARAPAFENWLAHPTAEELRAYPDRDGRPVDVLARLRGAEAVDALACRTGADRVRVFTKAGTVELAREPAAGPGVACRIVEGDDPLGYAAAAPAAALLDGKPHAPAEWLAATADTPHPDLVPQVMAYFDAARAGDIAVFAAPGWDFGHENKAGHGGLRPEDMYTILIMAGPGVPRGRRAAPARTVDLAPTLLELLGRPVPAGLDGRSLLAAP